MRMTPCESCPARFAPMRDCVTPAEFACVAPAATKIAVERSVSVCASKVCTMLPAPFLLHLKYRWWRTLVCHSVPEWQTKVRHHQGRCPRYFPSPSADG